MKNDSDGLVDHIIYQGRNEAPSQPLPSETKQCPHNMIFNFVWYCTRIDPAVVVPPAITGKKVGAVYWASI